MDRAPLARHKGTMRRLDLPPAWLLAVAALALVLARLEPASWTFGGSWATALGGLLGLGGAVLILLAVLQMRRHRTAVLPRRDASRLLSTGLFALTRNPIYLGMASILAGVVLLLDAPLALPLVPLYVALIQARFVRGEEAALARLFGPDFDRYRAATRPWL